MTMQNPKIVPNLRLYFIRCCMTHWEVSSPLFNHLLCARFGGIRHDYPPAVPSLWGTGHQTESALIEVCTEDGGCWHFVSASLFFSLPSGSQRLNHMYSISRLPCLLAAVCVPPTTGTHKILVSRRKVRWRFYPLGSLLTGHTEVRLSRNPQSSLSFMSFVTVPPFAASGLGG